MPLDRQIFALSFAQGVDTQPDPKQIDAGKLAVLENAVFGTPKLLKKRNGFKTIESLTALLGGATPGFLGTLKGELLAGTGAAAYGFSSQGPVYKGVCEALRVSSQPVNRNAYQQSCPDMAAHPGGLSVFTWEDTSGGIRYTVQDTATGLPVVSNVAISATGQKPKAYAIGSYLVVLYFDSASASLRYVPIPVATPQSPMAVQDLALDPQVAPPVYDATVVGGLQGRIFVVYVTTGGKVSVTSILSTLVAGAPTIVATATPGAVAICGNTSAGDQRVWVFWATAAAVLGAIYPFDMSAPLRATTTVEALANVRNLTAVIPESVSPDVAQVLYDVTGSQPYNSTLRRNTLNWKTGAVGTAASVARSVGLASKPWVTAYGQTHSLVAYQSALQPTYFVMTKDGAIVGKLAPGTGGGLTAKPILPEVVSLSPGVWNAAFLQASDTLESQAGTILSQIGVMEATFDFTVTQMVSELGDSLHITGGILYMFDGLEVCEHGFHLFPENVSAAPSGTGLTGQYQYVAVYEWMDNYGQIHRSAPSTPVTVVAANQGYTLTVPTLRLTSKQTPIAIVIYRTLANQSTFYRVTPIPPSVLNSTSADTVTYTDNAADSVILGNEQLYTTGGVLENIAAPAPKSIGNYRGRLILIPSEKPNSWWASKQIQQDFPVEFSDVIVNTIDQLGGDVNVPKEMDSYLVFLKNARCFVLVGDGPAADGSNSDYRPPNRVESDAGAVDINSVVAMPLGLMFKSPKGIYLLDRSLNASYIGSDVDGWNAYSVTSAQHIASEREVRFTLSSGDALYYNYNQAQWSVARAVSGVASVGFQGLYTFLDPIGRVRQETPSAFTDDGLPIIMRVRTAWLSLAGLQAFQRIYRLLVLGDYRSPHRLLVSLAYDFNHGLTFRTEIDAAALIGAPVFGMDIFGADSPFGGSENLYQFRYHMPRQKCQAIQITMEEVQDAPYGEGLRLSALGIEVGAKKGLDKVPAVRSFG